jgi:methionyl-tRNA formyltransferase
MAGEGDVSVRLAFFGLPIAALALARDGHELGIAVLSPVEHPGRRRLGRLVPPDRLVDALSSPTGFERRVEDVLVASRPDLLVSWYWTRLLPSRWLGLPALGAIGVHPSLLPHLRGPNPFFWSIDSGDHWTGVTVHRLTAEYDRGDILLQQRLEVGSRDAWQLARALDRPSLSLLRLAVSRLARGDELPGLPQAEADATWAPEPSGDALRVDWNWSTERILRRIRALAPVPGLALEVAGLRFFITRAEPVPNVPLAMVPGEAALLGDPPAVLAVRTRDGAIGVHRAVAGLGAELEPGQPIEAEELALLVARRRGVLDWVPPEE